MYIYIYIYVCMYVYIISIVAEGNVLVTFANSVLQKAPSPFLSSRFL